MVEFDRLAPIVQTNAEAARFWNNARQFVDPVIQFAYDNDWITRQTILAPMFQPIGSSLTGAPIINVGIAVPHPETALPIFFAGVQQKRVTNEVTPFVRMVRTLPLTNGSCLVIVQSTICDIPNMPRQSIYAKSVARISISTPMGRERLTAEWSRDTKGNMHTRKPFAEKFDPSPREIGVATNTGRKSLAASGKATTLVQHLSAEIAEALSDKEPMLVLANWNPLKHAFQSYQPTHAYRLVASCMTQGTFDNSSSLTADEMLALISEVPVS